MHKLLLTAALMVACALIGTMPAEAHCGTCGVEAKHDHDHEASIKPYVKGETKCCSAEHYTKTQKESVAEKAKKDYKEGACCSADHYASKKVEAAELAAHKSEYKKGETKCCSAEHYAKKKMEDVKKDK